MKKRGIEEINTIFRGCLPKIRIKYTLLIKLIRQQRRIKYRRKAANSVLIKRIKILGRKIERRVKGGKKWNNIQPIKQINSSRYEQRAQESNGVGK